MNKAAILLCKDDLAGVKNHLDQLLVDQNMKVITLDSSSESMIPDYLVNLLVYFLIKTSKSSTPNLTLCLFCRELSDCQTFDEVSSFRGRSQLLRPKPDFRLVVPNSKLRDNWLQPRFPANHSNLRSKPRLIASIDKWRRLQESVETS